MTCKNLELEEIKRLMDKERRALPYAPNRKAYNDTKNRWKNLKKEYDRRLRRLRNGTEGNAEKV